MSFLDDIKLFLDVISNIPSYVRKIDNKFLSNIKVLIETINNILKDYREITINDSSSITQIDQKK